MSGRSHAFGHTSGYPLASAGEARRREPLSRLSMPKERTTRPARTAGSLHELRQKHLHFDSARCHA
ncbi:hypothetical protein BV20DRAFT_92465 [Pilatotrama ljubarskyi]|nr:hypothetical protein BV20DRAFT_92465 [Pilatotrama ljubarskyi]